MQQYPSVSDSFLSFSHTHTQPLSSSPVLVYTSSTSLNTSQPCLSHPLFTRLPPLLAPPHYLLSHSPYPLLTQSYLSQHLPSLLYSPLTPVLPHFSHLVDSSTPPCSPTHPHLPSYESLSSLFICSRRLTFCFLKSRVSPHTETQYTFHYIPIPLNYFHFLHFSCFQPTSWPSLCQKQDKGGETWRTSQVSDNATPGKIRSPEFVPCDVL